MKLSRSGGRSALQRVSYRLAVLLLPSLAVLTSIYLLVIDTSASRRAVGVSISVLATLEYWTPWLSRANPAAGQLSIAVLALLNLMSHAGEAGSPIEHRLALSAILFCYLCALPASTVGLIRPAIRVRAMTVAICVALIMLVAESVLQQVFRRDPQFGRASWLGETRTVAIATDTSAGWTVMASRYPDDPRGYFENGDALRRAWSLDTHGKEFGAQLVVDSARRTLRVSFQPRDSLAQWAVQLNRRLVGIRANETYAVRFSARARTPRPISFGVSQAHASWQTLGLYQTVGIDSVWTEHRATFVGAADDSLARLHFDLSGDTAAVELANIALQTADGVGVMLAPPGGYSIQHRVDQAGCRGAGRQRAGRSLLVLGSGSALGGGVHDYDTFSSVLERRLERSGLQASVLNCSVPGHGPREARDSWRRLRLSPRPAAVVFVITSEEQLAVEREQRESPKRYAQLFDVLGLPRYLQGVLPGRTVKAEASRLAAEILTLKNDLGAIPLMVGVMPVANGRTVALSRELRPALESAGIAWVDMEPQYDTVDWRELVVHPTLDLSPNERVHLAFGNAMADVVVDRIRP